jgi:hypothetical protein
MVEINKQIRPVISPPKVEDMIGKLPAEMKYERVKNQIIHGKPTLKISEEKFKKYEEQMEIEK